MRTTSLFVTALVILAMQLLWHAVLLGTAHPPVIHQSSNEMTLLAD